MEWIESRSLGELINDAITKLESKQAIDQNQLDNVLCMVEKLCQCLVSLARHENQQAQSDPITDHNVGELIQPTQTISTYENKDSLAK